MRIIKIGVSECSGRDPRLSPYLTLNRVGLCGFALCCALVYPESVVGQSARYHYGTGLRPLVIEHEETGYTAEWVVPLPGGVQVHNCIEGGGSISYQLQDHLGSPRVLVDFSGSVSGHCEYDAYGVLTTGGASCAYTGHEMDSETGLYRTPTRFYGAEAGRFISVDPVPESWTPYNYAGNQPTGSIDPSGSVVLNITENARGRFLPNPEGIVLYGHDPNLPDRNSFRAVASELDNFLAISSEEFFSPSSYSIVFPATVDTSGIGFVALMMHGSEDGLFFPFSTYDGTSGAYLAYTLVNRFHYSDPRYGTSEPTIMEQIEHISCQTCYGARLAENASQHLSNLSSLERLSTTFDSVSDLFISGSPYQVWTPGDRTVAVLEVRGSYYWREDLAKGYISSTALEAGYFQEYTVSQQHHDALDRQPWAPPPEAEEEFHDALEYQPHDPALPDSGGDLPP